MPFATINGITLPIRDGSLKQSIQEIGERGQAFDGTAYQAIRARKRKWQFSTTPMSQADSLAWIALLNGQAVNWDFETDTYSLQGHAATVAGTATRTTAAYKFGAASLTIASASSSSAAWSVGVGSSWTVACWRRYYNGATWIWQHRVTTSTGVFYSGGTATTDANPPTVAAGVLTLAGGLNSNSVYYDDLWILPAVVPASWPAQMAAHGAQLVDASGFTLSGDIVPAAVACVGQVTGSKALQGVVGGSFVSNAVELEVEIVEA